MSVSHRLVIFAAVLWTASARHLPNRGSDNLIASRRPVRDGRASRRAMLQHRTEAALEVEAPTAAQYDQGMGMSSACLVSTMTASVGTCM